MLQGYSIENAVSRRKSPSSSEILIPLFAGWLLFVGTWYVIISNWWTQFDEATKVYESCTGTDGSREAPSWVRTLIWVVFAFYVSFGIVNLVYVFRPQNFVAIETSYIVLSFASKAFLMIYAITSIFGGTVWLKRCPDPKETTCVASSIEAWTRS